MLRKLRIAIAAVFFIGITLLFVGIGQQWWGWMAKIQFLPAALALNVAVLAGLILLTLLFGRVYCSVICPLGILQDISAYIRREAGKRIKGKPVKRFTYSKERKWLRYGILGAYIICLVLGLQVVVAVIAPYSSYGRIVRSFCAGTPWQVIVAAAVIFVAVVVLAWNYGRIWCNTVCPVGTVLGLFSRFAIFRPTIDKSKCNHCGRCERGCKSSCINAKEQKFDYSRCVDCFDCIDRCSTGAIKFRLAYGPKAAKLQEAPAEEAAPAKETEPNGRREFLATAALLAVSAATARADGDGGLAAVLPKTDPGRDCRLVPFGAGSVKNFYDHCTGCQLCVSACPNHVLRASTDLAHLLQPQMGYENGWCRPECTACSDICPAGAIKPLAEGQKLAISIGVARIDHELCVINRDGVGCGNCARHCPVGAIRMVDGHPVVNEELCIGCGACENLCPSRPVSAIVVHGREVHKTE